MNRLIQTLVVLVLVVGLLQWFVPRWAGSLLANQLDRYDHGPPPVVQVAAVPFWELGGGRFQDVFIDAKKASIGGLNIQQVLFNWSNGGISLASLVKRHVKVTSPGTLKMSIVLTAAALSQFLAKQGSLLDPQVSISPAGVSLKGRLLLGGSYIPLDTHGALVESSDHQALVFHPTSIDGLHLPVLTDIQLLNLTTMKLPMALTIEGVHLKNNQATVTVVNVVH